jgi:hypothetical protein
MTLVQSRALRQQLIAKGYIVPRPAAVPGKANADAIAARRREVPGAKSSAVPST